MSQLQHLDQITRRRREIFENYQVALAGLAKSEEIELPKPLNDAGGNGHIFFIKLKDRSTREKLAQFLSVHQIAAYFHYIPLHSSKAGKNFGYFAGRRPVYLNRKRTLIAFALYYEMTDEEVKRVVKVMERFFSAP